MPEGGHTLLASFRWAFQSSIDKRLLLARDVHRTQPVPYYMINGSQSVYVRMYWNTTLVNNNRQ